jgi:hypothetical protein
MIGISAFTVPTFEGPTSIVDLFQIGSALAVAGALIYAALEYRNKNISEELNRSYSVLKDLREMETSLVEHPAYSDEHAMSLWYERYFNTWEWFSYMVNKKQIKDRKLLKFFKTKALGDYDKIFEPNYKGQLDNKDFYPEYKKLCKNLKELK